LLKLTGLILTVGAVGLTAAWLREVLKAGVIGRRGGGVFRRDTQPAIFWFSVGFYVFAMATITIVISLWLLGLVGPY
jgi:hypothetical protein